MSRSSRYFKQFRCPFQQTFRLYTYVSRAYVSWCAPPLRLGGVGISEFWVFGKDQNIFDFRRGSPVRGRGHISLGEVISFYVHFPILKCKVLKIQKFLPVEPSFSIFPYSDLRYMQCFRQLLTLTLNLNFVVKEAVSFHPSTGIQNQSNL